MDYTVLLLLCLVAGILGGPAGLRRQEATATTCSQQCTVSNKFSYAPGTTYEFKYEVETKTQMLGGSEDHSTIGISATANIEIHSKCELILQLRDISIFGYDSRKYTDQDVNKEFAQTLERFPLRFSFQDGVVQSVCPDPDDVTWAVNIKKGILSSFQNSMDNFEIDHKTTERDVSGTCDTTYTVAQQGWLSLTIKKSKDMSSCTDRHGYETAIQTTPFRISSGLKSLPILKSSYTCDQEVTTKGVLTSSLCHEIHTFRPFSKEQSGATTETTQKLNFVQEKQTLKYVSASMGDPQDLTFQHAQGESSGDLNAKQVLNFVRQMCDSTADDLRPETPREFSNLVFMMKKVDHNGLKRVFNQVQPKNKLCRKNAERIRKFVHDAIPMIGTGASIKLMKTLISNKDVEGTDADMWLASLAFVHHPTKDMLKEIKELLGLPSLSSKVLLPLSSMVHAYCRVNPECSEVAEVQAIIAELGRNIEGGCKVNQQNFKQVMMTLRALGNTGHAEAIVPSLYRCIGNKDNTMDIKIAAIQAFRRLSCGADRNNLMQTYLRTDEDSELRIAAYLGVMQCPNQYVIDQVKETLASEEVNQVGSFVWTHLTNLMESSDPANKYVKHILNDEVLAKEFDLDKRKFSRNYEGSFYLDKLNTGAKIDSNLVWSSKSFVPRSATLNLTMDVFGESLNLFELGGRVEGLEYLLEAYFGPVGYFKNSEKSSDSVSPSDPRPAKLSSNKLDAVHKQAKTAKDELRGAMYIRMFGNELTYNMFGANNGVEKDMSGSDMFNFLQKLRNNEQQDFTFTKSFMFLDSTYTVPTIAGLPLNLTINGTATVALNAGGHMDFKKPGASIVIEGNFEPSGAVEIESMMSVDAFVTKGGLKMLSTLHSSTGARGKIEITNRNVLDMSFDFTKEKSEILSLKTSFFMVYRDIEKEPRMLHENKHEATVCSGDKLRKVTGLEFCAEAYYPDTGDVMGAPSFPLTGPAGVSVVMNKRDIPNGYKVEAKTIKTPQQTLFRFLADTPGSEIDRALGIDVDVKHKDKTLTIDLISPWKKVNVQGELLDSPSLKGMTGTIKVDDLKEYKVDARIQIDETKDRMTYTPIVNIEIPDWKNVQLSGVLNYHPMEMLDTDLSVQGLFDDPIVFQTSLMNTDSQVGMKTKFNYQKGEGYIFEAFTAKKIQKTKKASREIYTPRVYARTPEKEFVEFTGSVEHVEGKSIRVDVKLDKVTKRPFTATADMTQVKYKKKGRTKYTSRVNIQGPKVTFKVMFTMDSRAWKTILSKARVDYTLGKGNKDTIVVNQRIKFIEQKTRQNANVKMTTNSLRNNNLDSNFIMNFVKKKYTTNIDASFKYGRNLKDKHTKNRLDLSIDTIHKLGATKKQLNYSVDFKFPAKDLTVMIEGGHIQDPKTILNDIKIRYHPERVVSMGIRLHNKSKQDLPNYAGEVLVSLPKGRELSFAGAFGKENANKYISNIEFELIKGQRSRIETMLKIATDHMYEAMVEIHREKNPLLKLEAGFTHEELGFSTFALFKRGEALYNVAVSTAMDVAKYYRYSIDVGVPSRRVTAVAESSRFENDRSYLIDIQWDADKDIDKRFLINTTVTFESMDSFEITGVLHYPSQTIGLDLKHSTGDRYITHLKLTWSPDNVIEASMTFRNDQPDMIDRRTELSVSFFSPFKNFRELGLEISHIKDKSRYQSKGSITWDKKKKILASATSKAPFDLNSMDIVGMIKTPFTDYENMNGQLKHRLSSDDLQSSLLIQWGRHRLSLNTVGQLEVTDFRRSFNGNFDLRTPFDRMRILVVKAQHSDDKTKYNTKFALESSTQPSQKQLDEYVIDIDMDIKDGHLETSNKGNIQITIPNDNIATTWEFELKHGKFHGMLDVLPQRGNRFKIQFDEAHQFRPVRMFSSSFELIIPTESIKELFINFNHEDRVGYLKTTGLITKDNLELFSAGVDYTRQYGSVDFNTHITSLYTEDVTLKLTSSHSMLPYRGHAEVQWAPYQVITVDSNYYFNEFGIIDSSVTFTSPFQRFRTITLKSSRERQGQNWITTTELEFAPRQVITLGTAYRYDHVKYTTVSLKTPFPQFPGLDASLKLDGSIFKLHGDASFKMVPYVDTISTNFNWAYYKGTTLSGVFNLKTPFQQYPYLKAKVSSNVQGMSRVSSFEVEYLPTQVIKITSNYRFTSIETLEGTITVASPFTEDDLVAGFTHVGNSHDFHTNAKITCKCISRPVFTEMTFSATDGIKNTFVMDSPFRGYETVKWNFQHQGQLDDFQTNVEYETNGQKISLNNMFSMTKNIKGEFTLTTPFQNMSRIHYLFVHDGKFPNMKTIAEAAYNDKEINADLHLAHDTKSSGADFKFTSPFPHMEIVKAGLHKSGTLSDFQADADLVYEQAWHASIKHKFDGQDIHTSGDLKLPYLEDDVTFNFTRTGKPLDFIMLTEYTVGPIYEYKSRTSLQVDLPNIAYESKTTSTVNGEEHNNGLSFYHNQKIDSNNQNIDISTKLTGNYNKEVLNADFGFQWLLDDPQNFKLLNQKLYLILEIPYPDLQYNRLNYESVTKRPTETTMEQDGKIELQSPLIETYRVKDKLSYDGTTYKRERKSSYGEYAFTEVEMYSPGSYSYKLTTPFDGYESFSLETDYNVDKANGGLSLSVDTIVSATPLQSPMRFDIKGEYNSFTDMEASAHMTSPFKGYTSCKTEFRNKQYGPDMKPNLKMTWVDRQNMEGFIEVEGIYTRNIYDSAGSLTTGIEIRTTFNELRDFVAKIDGSLYSSPMRSKGMMLAQYNGQKYLDVDSEFSTLDKFSGIIDIRAPRGMEFSFRGINEGESVEGDLVINWNKEDDKSLVRLEFGLADTGNEDTEKKDFHVRLTNPNRIVGYSSKYMQTSEKTVSSAKVSWDEANKQEASYESEFSMKPVRLGMVYDYSVKVMMPTRTVEAASSYTDGKAQKVGNLVLLWDAENDRGKEVDVRFTVAPYDVQKVVQVELNVPSLNKQLTTRTEVTADSGKKLLDGKTEFTYCSDKRKKITTEYSVEKTSDDSVSLSWNVIHPDTKTNILMKSSLTNTVAKATSEWQLEYLTSRSGKKMITLKTDVNKEKPEFNIEVITPSEKASLAGHMTTESPYMMMMQASHNDKVAWKTEWNVDTLDRSLSAVTSYSKDSRNKRITTTALFPNETSFVTETSRQTGVEKIEEGMIKASLNYRLLHGHLKWRPDMLKDITEFGSDYLKEVTYEMSIMVKMITRELGDELLYKYNGFKNSFSEEMEPLSDRFAEELVSIQKEVKLMRKELRRMYKDNDLYLQTMEQVYTGTVKNMLASYSVAIVKLREAYSVMDEKFEELTNKIDSYPFKDRYNDMMNTVTNKVDEYKVIVGQEIDKILEKLLEALNKMDDIYRETVVQASEQLRAGLTEMFDELTLQPFLEDLEQIYDKVLSEYPELSSLGEINSELIKQIQELLTAALEQTDLLEKYKTISEHAKEIITDQFGGVLENEDVQQLYSALIDLYDQSTWLYKYTKMDITLRELIDKVVEKARAELMKEFDQLPLGLLDLHKSKVTTFDLDNGEIEFDLYLPIPMENFEKLMRFSLEKYAAKLTKLADKYFPRRDFCVWDMIYSLKPVQWSMEKDWMPPFDAYATVYGKQHYTTFDGSHFDLAGLCSYILVQDMVDRNFTIVQKYRGGPRQLKRDSLVIMLDGMTFELFQDYMIQVDGQPRDLPYTSDQVSIIRLGNRVIFESQSGVNVLSDFKSNYHFIGLSGWYFGKVAGVLGTYDNEPSNDLMIPSGAVVKPIKKFMNEWEVGDRCRSKNMYTDAEKKVTHDGCSATFEKTSSSLRPCFMQVDPDEYLNSCNMEPDSLCDIAALYTHSCAKKRVTVYVPDSCVKCEAHDNIIYKSGETLKYRSDSGTHQLQSSMDIVFVVEERQCNRDIANKLKDIVYEMEKSLTKTGSSDNRYSLIGYAGNLVNSHTMEGQIFNGASKFAKGVESFKFANLGPYTDPLSAILKASNMPFRTGVTKAVVLVSCSPCTESTGYSFTSLNSVLQQRDITLHILRQTGFMLKNNRSPKNKIYGVDNSNMYMWRQGEDAFSDVEMPTDYCATLAMRTNGSLFDATHSVQGNLRQQRHFMRTLGDRVGMSGSQTKCQECSCELDETGTPASVCRRCDLQPFYFKSLPLLMNGAVQAKNQISQKIEAILF